MTFLLPQNYAPMASDKLKILAIGTKSECGTPTLPTFAGAGL